MLRVTPGTVCRIVLDRPEVRNAFNDELIAALTEAFRGLDSQTRVVVLSGEGKAFCAGGDLDWMRRAASYSEEENYRDALALARLFEAIANCPAAVIAQVHGAAFGGGCGLVAASDIAVCASDCRFSFSEVRLGLIPGTISQFVLPKIGAGHARALFISGEVFAGDDALRIGLVHRVVSQSELPGAVEEKVGAVLLSGPEAVAASKRLVLDSPISLEESARRLAAARASDEGREGVAAFLEKRPPNWAS